MIDLGISVALQRKSWEPMMVAHCREHGMFLVPKSAMFEACAVCLHGNSPWPSIDTRLLMHLRREFATFIRIANHSAVTNDAATEELAKRCRAWGFDDLAIMCVWSRDAAPTMRRREAEAGLLEVSGELWFDSMSGGKSESP